jgi:hypothetical protein
MASLARRFWPCLDAICESVNSRKKITYQELADKLGLKSPKQEWHTVLDIIAGKARRELGADYDLTWNVVYGSGPAEHLGRYFSNGDRAIGSTLLNPKDRKQVTEYERTLKKIYRYTYELQKIEGKDTLIMAPRK